LNPRYAYDVYTISNRAPSTTQPFLHGQIELTVNITANLTKYIFFSDDCQINFTCFTILFSSESKNVKKA